MLAVAAVSALLVAFGSAGFFAKDNVVSASASNDFSDTAAKFEQKYGLDRISGDVGRSNPPSKSGFISASVNWDDRLVDVYWAGTPSASDQKFIDSKKGVSVHAGTFSSDYMHAVGIQVAEQIPKLKALKGLEFGAVKPHVDGSGIDLELTQSSDPKTNYNVDQLQKLLSDEFDFPVTILISDSGPSFPKSR